MWINDITQFCRFAGLCTPVAEAWANLDLCSGDLGPVHDYPGPGERLFDLFSGGIVVDVVSTSSSKVETALNCRVERTELAEKRNASLLSAFTSASTELNKVVIVTDSSTLLLNFQAVGEKG